MIGGVDRDYDSIGGCGCNTWIRPRRKSTVVRRIAETTTGAAERDGCDATGGDRDEITPGQGVAMHNLRILGHLFRGSMLRGREATVNPPLRQRRDRPAFRRKRVYRERSDKESMMSVRGVWLGLFRWRCVVCDFYDCPHPWMNAALKTSDADWHP